VKNQLNKYSVGKKHGLMKQIHEAVFFKAL